MNDKLSVGLWVGSSLASIPLSVNESVWAALKTKESN